MFVTLYDSKLSNFSTEDILPEKRYFISNVEPATVHQSGLSTALFVRKKKITFSSYSFKCFG